MHHDLIGNWRSAAGDLKRDGITPSVSASYFASGLWAWDTWKQAVAVAHFHPELAEESIRSMFDSRSDPTILPDRKTKYGHGLRLPEGR